MADRHSFALEQLDRVSEQVPRVESKVAALLPVAVAMLAVLALKAPVEDPISWIAAAAVISAACLVMCLWRIYATFFPQMAASGASVIFFAEASKLSQDKFVQTFAALDNAAILRDASTQIWRTSVIVSTKFAMAKAAFQWLAFALAPWLTFLVLVTLKDGKIPVIAGG